MVQDIRELDPSQHWDAFEDIWTGLMSYRYLNKTNPELDLGFQEGDLESMPIRHDMRNAHGGIMAAPLAICCPEPWWNDDVTIPAPVISSIQILDDARGVSKVEVLREVINIGRQMGYSRSKIVDASDHSRVIAVSAGMGVSLGDVPDGYEKVENPPVPVIDSPDLPRLHEVFGAVKGDDGWYRLPVLQKEFSAPHAALHLGPIHIVFDVTAHEQAAALAGTDALQVDNWYVQFVKPGLEGPFRCEGVAIEGRDGRINVDLTLHDEGKGDRIITTGSAVFHRT
jgi:acyl-coenzyme A thioesterase PaaI-like protein